MRLFDSPSIDPAMAANVNAPSHVQVAKEAAIQGTVLLKNTQGVLPVTESQINSVALIGPFADNPTAQLGGYSSGDGQNGRKVVTIADALEDRFSASKITKVQGASGGRGGPGEPPPSEGIQAAVAASEAADLTVVVVGTMACGCCDRCGNGEVGDRASLDLEGSQQSLVAAIANISTHKPNHAWVVVLIHGRPVSWGEGNELLDSIPALLAAWRPGEQGGPAIVDLIFGDANPSAKLAQAWPRSAGHIHGPSNPWYQPHTSMTGGLYFGYGDGTPLSALFPFGFGLSYTEFAISPNATISAVSGPLAHGLVLRDRYVSVSVTITNTGALEGSTPIMATFSKTTRLVIRYLRQLVGFTKVKLKPGESATVDIPLKISDFARYDPRVTWKDLDGRAVTGAYVVDPGEYTVFVGDCVSVGAVWNDADTCPPSRQVELTFSLDAPPSDKNSRGTVHIFDPEPAWVFL